ncbi:MAG: acyl-CoA thioesterase [Gaiellaceae bacterium]
MSDLRSGRASFPSFLAIPTRWHDNDLYGHVNNVIYYAFFDTVINEFLIREGGLDIHEGSAIGVCAESSCRFLDSFEYPEVIDAGLRVGELRTRSVSYEIGLFRAGRDEPAATGSFAHVFVDRETRRPTAIPDGIRAALERIAG